MDFDIVPNAGAGSIRFGMAPTAARACIGGNFRSFKRTDEEAYPSDYFEHEGVFLYYNAQAALEAIEFVRPARVSTSGLSLLDMSFNEAIKALSLVDKSLAIENDGAIARGLGVSIYAPLAKENSEAAIGSVMVFSPGYFG